VIFESMKIMILDKFEIVRNYFNYFYNIKVILRDVFPIFIIS